MSVVSFDSQFQSIPFYKTHPYMMPFVGNDYESSNHKKLLVVGENHYMCENSTIHHKIDDWYNQPNLSDAEVDFCNTQNACEKICNSFVKMLNAFLKRIYKNSENALQEIAYYNFYLRPADYKQNMKSLWKKFDGAKKDMDCALNVFPRIFDILRPDFIVFLGQTVWICVNSYLRKELCGDLENIVHTYSPSRYAWHRSGKGNVLSENELYDWLMKKWLI